MELRTTIETLSALSGPAGMEETVREYLMGCLTPLCDTVETDAMGNVIALRRCGKPGAKKVLLDAHMDEVGLIVTGIDRGFLRFASLGGVDARLLPATEVTVLTEPPIPGVIDTMPPHALQAADMEKAVPMDKLVIDIGMTQSEAEREVPLGTAAAFTSRPVLLENNRLAGKSLDNRACVAIVLQTLENLQAVELPYDLYCMFSAQEELGMRGAPAGVYGIDPDYAVVLDVTHGKTPDAQSVTVMDLDRGPAIGIGPNMTHAMTMALKKTAEREQIPYQMEVMHGTSGTDAWPIQIARGGIATAVLSLPLRYMHGPFEVISLNDAQAVTDLLTAFLKDGEVTA